MGTRLLGKQGYLILENGQVFSGVSFGKTRRISGEAVFNTGMVGYPEGLTDPSYSGQILTLTYPLVGNYGVPTKKFFESEKIRVAGLVVDSYIEHKSHWQAKRTLSSWLKTEGIPALQGIDTRTLTKTLRSSGVMKAVLTFKKPAKKNGLVFKDINQENLVSRVSCKRARVYKGGKRRILVLDCGLKANQIRIFLDRGCTVIRVPWDYNPFATSLEFDGVFVSNGPGDPKMARETIKILKEIMRAKIPTLGICLGNQLLALAAGADTFKMKYGHRGQNQPVKDLKTGRCFVTTQNHGYAVDNLSIPTGWEPWFVNLNDATNEGLRHKKLPFLSVQFHPEAKPGPTDTEWIFDYFLERVKNGKR